MYNDAEYNTAEYNESLNGVATPVITFSEYPKPASNIYVWSPTGTMQNEPTVPTNP